MHILIAALHRPTRPTGVCRHAVNLAQCLADKSELTKVTLLIGAWQQEYFNRAFSIASTKIDLVNVDIKNTSLSRNAWFLWGLPKLAKRLNPDLVHLSFPLPFVRGLFPCPVVSTIHDLYPYECPENFGYPQVLFNQLFLKQCVENSDGLSCVSEVTLEKLKTYFPKLSDRKKKGVMYNYVDFSRTRPKSPKSLERTEDQPFILSVAQHRKNKNLDMLIKAYDLLLKQERLKPETQLILIGSSGPETNNLKQLIQSLELNDRVLLLSSVSDDELSWMYKHCDLFVATSSTEGFCLPLAEAIHFSKKIVCSDIPIFKEIGSPECEYFCLKGDVIKNLYEKIGKHIYSSTPVNSSQVSRFSKTHIANEYLDLYKSISPNILEACFS